MKSTDPYRDSFIASARARDNIFQEPEDPKRWLKSLQETSGDKVEQVPLDQLEQWYFETDTGNLRHRSGKFFSIVGLDCRPEYEGSAPWQQPIIVQPEVGILGILTKEFDGTRYFLMQAKMEPGNVNKVQLSPTVQATHSNYTRTHQGRLPPYLEYFLDDHAVIIRSQLQSETGTRFYRKYNRNVLLDATGEVEVRPGFRWLTLGEIQALMSQDNAVNMDTRSVLSNISWSGAAAGQAGGSAFLRSADCGPAGAWRRREDLRAWLAAMRGKYAIATVQIPLNAVRDWGRDEWEIRHVRRNFFSVAGVRVEAKAREVARWCQPLLKHEGLGLAGFLCTEIGGVLHFLIQAKPEPGIAGSVELGPTVSVFDYRRRPEAAAEVPFMPYFLDPRAQVLHSSIQSEEGGRFWRLCNRFLLVKVPARDALPAHERYQWMTLEQLQQFSQGECLVNSEARSLLSCLNYFF